MRWRTKRPEPELWARLKPKALEMHNQPTAAEARLWAVLKNGNLDGFKFRRQHAIETYIVDFFCAEANLVIEVDGSVHEGNEEQDAYRQGILETSGFRVLRFKNEQVGAEGVAAVKQAIREALTNNPGVVPSPSGMERGAGRRGEVGSFCNASGAERYADAKLE